MKTDLATIGGAKGKELLAALQKQEPGWLDRPIQEVVKMVDIGNIWLQAQRAILKKMPKGDDQVTSDFYKSRLESVRNSSRGWFLAVMHLGEELISQGETRGRHEKNSSARRTLIDISGISKVTAFAYRKIAENPDAVDVAFEKASDRNNIPGVRTVLEVLGYSPGGGKKPGGGKGHQTADQAAKKIVNQLLEINMVLARLVEHLDHIKSENARALHEALQRTVEIWTAKAPAEYKKLARGIA